MTTRKSGATRSKGSAARAERNGNRSLQYEGLKLSLPPKLPFVVMKYLRSDDPIGALEVIVGPDQLEAIWDAELDLDQGRELVGKVIGEYGLEPGESPASQKS